MVVTTIWGRWGWGYDASLLPYDGVRVEEVTMFHSWLYLMELKTDFDYLFQVFRAFQQVYWLLGVVTKKNLAFNTYSCKITTCLRMGITYTFIGTGFQMSHEAGGDKKDCANQYGGFYSLFYN